MRATLFSIIIVSGLIMLLSSPAASAPLYLAPVAQGSSATYAFSITATSAHTCYSSQTTGAIVACPLYPDWVIEANGTIAWRAVSVNQTSAVLNDTITLNLGSGVDSLSLGPFSFLESVNLSSRQVTLLPSQVEAQTVESLVSQYGTMFPTGGLNASLFQQFHSPRVHTIWWVHTPLSLGDNVTVLAFPTRVNGTRTVDLGSLGTRSAWTLSASLSRSLSTEMPCAVNCPYSASSASLLFAYDQSNGMLLSSNLDVQTYSDTIPVYSAGISSSIASIVSASTVHATLKLVSQDANLLAGGVTFYPNPSLGSPTSNGSNNNQTPASNSNNDQASSAPTLLAAIAEPRNVATVALAIAIVGLLGLLVFRRARKHTERSSATG